MDLKFAVFNWAGSNRTSGKLLSAADWMLKVEIEIDTSALGEICLVLLMTDAHSLTLYVYSEYPSFLFTAICEP